MRNIFDRTKSLGAKLRRNNLGIRIEVQRRRRFKWPGEDNRFDYQKGYVKFDIQPGDQVLDIGSGGDPFPYATVLTDRFLENSPYRSESLVRDNKPFLLSDIHELPFRDKGFDFVYCAHVLEVVKNPLRACAEIMRVGKRGFIETRRRAKTCYSLGQEICKSGMLWILGEIFASLNTRNASWMELDRRSGEISSGANGAIHFRKSSTKIKISSM